MATDESCTVVPAAEEVEGDQVTQKEKAQVDNAKETGSEEESDKGSRLREDTVAHLIEISTEQPSKFEEQFYKYVRSYDLNVDVKDVWVNHSTESISVKARPEDPDTIKSARSLGFYAMKHSFFRNLLQGVFREIVVYGMFGVMIAFFIFSLYSLIDSLVNGTEEIEKNFSIADFFFSLFGLTFSAIDVSLHFRHRGFRTCKRLHKKVDIVQEGDQEEKEFCNVKCDEGTKGKNFVFALDVIRIFVLESIFYPKLLLSMFQFIVYLVEISYQFKLSKEWLSIVGTVLATIIFSYLMKAQVIFRIISSVKELRAEGVKWKQIFFVITFVIYMYGLLALQILMVVIIGGRFHHDYTVNGGITGQLYYMMVCAFLMPLLGTITFLVVHHFWTMKQPVDVLINLILEMQSKGKEAKSSKRKEETAETIKSLKQKIGDDQFNEDYEKMQQTRFLTKFSFPFSSPFHGIIACLYSIMLVTFCLCCIINGPQGYWWMLYLFAGYFGFFINIYPLAIFAVWVFLLLNLINMLIFILIFAVVCVCICPARKE